MKERAFRRLGLHLAVAVSVEPDPRSDQPNKVSKNHHRQQRQTGNTENRTPGRESSRHGLFGQRCTTRNLLFTVTKPPKSSEELHQQYLRHISSLMDIYTERGGTEAFISTLSDLHGPECNAAARNVDY